MNDNAYTLLSVVIVLFPKITHSTAATVKNWWIRWMSWSSVYDILILCRMPLLFG